MKTKPLSISDLIEKALRAYNESHAGISIKPINRMAKAISTLQKNVSKLSFEGVDNEKISNQIKESLPKIPYQKPLVQSFASCGFGIEVR